MEEQEKKLHEIIKAQEAAINYLKQNFIGFVKHDDKLVDIELMKETSDMVEFVVKLTAKADKMVDEVLV